MLCKPCFANRIRRDGGHFGLCWQHRKTKCRVCRKLSDGKLTCSKCEHTGDLARWKAESRPTHYDEDYQFFHIQLRRERLWESKRHVHRAVEILFRAMVLTLDALWGGIKDPHAAVESDDFPKAA